MAVWITLDKKYWWKTVAEISLKYKLFIGDWKRYDLSKTTQNAIKIRFAAYNEAEIYELINRLSKIFSQLKIAAFKQNA